jgi:hypothetical protein
MPTESWGGVSLLSQATEERKIWLPLFSVYLGPLQVTLVKAHGTTCRDLWEPNHLPTATPHYGLRIGTQVSSNISFYASARY